MGRREVRSDADALVCMGIVDALLERGTLTREDRERARVELLEGASPLCVLLTEEPCYVRGPE